MEKIILVFLMALLWPMENASSQKEKTLLNRKVDITLESATLDEVLKRLSELGEFNLTYSKESLNFKRPVSIQVKDKKVVEVLEMIFKHGYGQYKAIGNNLIIYKEKKVSPLKNSPSNKHNNAAKGKHNG